MTSFPRPLFKTFKRLGRNWFKRTRPDHIQTKPHFEFTVASYNVLADKLLHEHPHLYHNSDNREQWVFDWNYRKSNLIEEVLYANVDILCLQEVEEEHYDTWYNPILEKYGYKGIYKKRSGNKTDGCATFFKKDLFTVHSFELVDFYRPGNPMMDRNNVAIILILNPKSKALKDPSPICIGNTHLLFNKKRGDIKLTQIAHLFAEIDRLTKQTAVTTSRNSSEGNSPRMPLILCGDFNSLPHSPLYDFVTKGELRFRGLKKSSISGQQCDSDFSYLFEERIFPPSAGLTHNCTWANESKSTSSNHQSLFDLSLLHHHDVAGVLNHDLDFESCYMHTGLDGTPEVTTCHDRACCTVDYIFYSPSQPTGASAYHQSDRHRLWLSGVLSLLSERDLQKMGNLPNKEVSSDHLLLMAAFVLT